MIEGTPDCFHWFAFPTEWRTQALESRLSLAVIICLEVKGQNVPAQRQLNAQAG